MCYLSPSILISSGPSLLRENPLSAWSICMEEQPASKRTASMLPGFTLMLDSRTSSSLNRPSSGLTRPLKKGWRERKWIWQLDICISATNTCVILMELKTNATLFPLHPVFRNKIRIKYYSAQQPIQELRSMKLIIKRE